MNTTGFPSPAQGYEEGTFDFNSILVTHPAATFCMRYTGTSLTSCGIYSGDILVVDSAAYPSAGKLAAIDTMLGDFRCVTLVQPASEGSAFRYDDGTGTLRPVDRLFGMVKGVVRLL